MIHSKFPEKLSILEKYCSEKEIKKEKISSVFEMLSSPASPSSPFQFPNFYIRDEKASAWHDPKKYSWVEHLEENFELIKEEAICVFEQNLMDIHPENDDLAGYGTWNTFFFYKNGIKFSQNHARCPKTSKILEQILGVDIAGRTYFSAMTPGIHIKPHCGPHNFKLRTHLGLITPEQARIRVSDETRNWSEGHCLVFDDSFEHEVWNKSESTRIVLIVDVWNPSLTVEEIAALRYIMPEFYHSSEKHEATI